MSAQVTIVINIRGIGEHYMSNQKGTTEHTKYYSSSGIEVPSCTNIVKLLNKPELVGWANYMGFRKVDVNKFLNERASFGTACHAVAERFGTGIVSKQSDIPLRLSQVDYTYLIDKLTKFFSSLQASNMSVVGTELILHGERFGGTPDLLCMHTDTKEYTLFDYKTSKKVYDSHWIQLAGYTMLLEELYQIRVSYIGVVLLSKDFEDKDFATIITRESNKTNEEIFNKLLDIYWLQNKQK